MNLKEFGSRLLVFTAITAMLVVQLSVPSAALQREPADAQGEALLVQLLDCQFEALVTGENVDTSDIFAESPSTAHYNKFLEWRITEAKLLNTLWDEYSYDFEAVNVSSIKGTGEIKAVVSSIYTLAVNGLECGQTGYTYNVTVIQTPNGARINDISSTEGMYLDFCANILSVETIAISAPQGEAVFEEAMAGLDVLADQMENISYVAPVPDNTSTPITPARATTAYSYRATVGVEYANKYYSTNNTCFKTASPDCTNFVSQCIWAAYGGWSPGDTVATMTTNIANRKRMMSSSNITNWFGHNNGHGNPWENVENLWSFVTGNPSEGPKANGYNNNGLYTAVVPQVINNGEVLQFWNHDLNRYRHSVYVVKTLGWQNTSYYDVKVAAHSQNGLFPLSDKIAGFGGSNCKMRRLSFIIANFAQ